MKRRYELDVIRSFAFLMIFVFHFNMMILQDGIEIPFSLIVKTKSQTLGQLGVGLFLILSGFVLVSSFERTGKKPIPFYLKRLLAIFPLFYACYFVAYLWIDLPAGHLFSKNMVWTLFGFDGFLSARGITTSYRVGEWYLGVILIYYLLFPALFCLIKKHPWFTGAAILGLYSVFTVFYPFSYLPDVSPIVRLPEFAFGIYIALYYKKESLPLALAGGVMFLLLTFIEFPGYQMHGTLIATISLFLCMYTVFRCIAGLRKKVSAPGNVFPRIIFTISKYSFSMFLLHHIVQEQLFKPHIGNTVSAFKYFAYFIYCLFITLLIAYLVQNGTETIVRKIRSRLKKAPATQEPETDQTSINT